MMAATKTVKQYIFELNVQLLVQMALVAQGEFPTFQRYVRQGARGGWIDYKDPKATKELARTLLRALYGLQYWSIPDGYAGVQHFGLLPLPSTAIR